MNKEILENEKIRSWEMQPGKFYMSSNHIYKTDGIKFFKRPFDVWSSKYLPSWIEVYPIDIEPLFFQKVKAGTRFPLLPK